MNINDVNYDIDFTIDCIKEKACIDGLKHGEAIYKIFELLFEPWMSVVDKLELIKLALRANNKKLGDLDNELEVGLKNGYSIEDQISLCKDVFRKLS